MNRRSFLKFVGLAPVVPLMAIAIIERQPKVFSPEWITGTQKIKVIKVMSMTLKNGDVKYFNVGDVISVTIEEVKV